MKLMFSFSQSSSSTQLLIRPLRGADCHPTTPWRRLIELDACSRIIAPIKFQHGIKRLLVT
jgi:hypothetical protein